MEDVNETIATMNVAKDVVLTLYDEEQTDETAKVYSAACAYQLRAFEEKQ